jgi:hypothetical protein
MRINDVMGLLVSTYTEWSHVLANPRFVRKGRIITWQEYSSAKLMLPTSHSDVLKLYEGGQYSFQTVDGSLLQIHYAYARTTDELIEARLAFYKVDQRSWEFEENFSEEGPNDQVAPPGSEALDPIMFRQCSISWLRIDYAPKSASGVLHNSCHLHLSSFPTARLVVAGVPTPKQFLEFVMALCYPDLYRTHRLDENGNYREPNELLSVNSDPVPFREDPIFRQVTHIRIPGVLPAPPVGRKRRR